MKRRDFLNKVAIGTVSGAGVISVAAILTEIMPPETESYRLLNLGYIDDYPLNDFSFIPEKKIYLQRTRQHLRAISGVCTHLGCTVSKSEKGFQCPCHGSEYDKLGQPISGPASRELDRYRINLSKEGEIIVDLNELVNDDFQLG
jgi:cytochrome b6-f complex iron-sulfur subunit